HSINNPRIESVKELIEEDGVIASIRVLSMLYNSNELSASLIKTTRKSSSTPKFFFDRTEIKTIIPFWAFYCTMDPNDFSRLISQPELKQILLPQSVKLDPDIKILRTLPIKPLYFTYVALHTNPSLLSSYFSLLNYGFLLDTEWKQRVVRVESLSWM